METALHANLLCFLTSAQRQNDMPADRLTAQSTQLFSVVLWKLVVYHSDQHPAYRHFDVQDVRLIPAHRSQFTTILADFIYGGASSKAKREAFPHSALD